MSLSDKRFILLFLKIVFPIITIVAISTYMLFIKIEYNKRALMYEKVIILADFISNVYKFDQKYSKKVGYDLEAHQATLLQVQSTFQEFNKSNKIFFEYLLAKKTSSHIEFIAYSSAKKPPSIKLTDTYLAVPMRKALNGLDGVEIKDDYHKNKVFSAFMKIENTPWALVIKQPYEEHIKDFKSIAFYTTLVLIVSLIFLYKILKSTEKKHIESIRRSEDRFKQLVESTYDWVWEVDASGRYQYISNQIENILGYSANEIVGTTPFELMSEEESLRVSKIFVDIIKKREKIVNLENVNLHKDGREVTLLTNGSPFFGANGELLGYRGIDKDISNLKAKEKELMKLAYYDVLTGLANRKTISIRIDEEISYAARNNTNSALIFMDLDGFKHINDSLGHNYGDKVLQEISARILSTLRDFDVASRVGGDEFILLIRGKEDNCDKCKNI